MDHRLDRRNRIACGNPWSAGCAETCSSGAEGGPGKRASRNAGTAPRPDPYTRLRTTIKGVFHHLYVIIDVYSRYVVGWHVATREDSLLAKELIDDAVARNGTRPHVLHADRGSSMTSKPVAELLSDLDITRSYSRPRVSNDNPYSEAQFKTLKYCPAFPARFTSIEHARQFCAEFFTYYNHDHRHSGIGLHTPASVHFHTADDIREQRQRTLDTAWRTHPDRFARRPRPPARPDTVWINQPIDQPALHTT